MSWRKYFTPAKTNQSTNGTSSPLTYGSSNKNVGPARSNYSSYLPDVYVGAPNRIDRYGQYNTMDLDSEVNAALDILAEFCTQKNTLNNTPFIIDYNQEATNSEVTIILQYLRQWCKLQNFETRMFRTVRNTFKYGDQFFLRDPETKKWYHIDPMNVTRVIVNESEGKVPEQYVLENINFNFVHGIATTPRESTGNITGGTSQYQPVGNANGLVGQTRAVNTSRFNTTETEVTVDAKHVIHLSLSEGLDNNFPFGTSLLEIIFKVYKQKELLEDAIIIYRVQRAPERRVFYVDVGNMPSHLAMQFVERVKTEIHQRRIPSATGGGQSVIDAAYNPLCLDLTTKIPLLDGRTLTLNELIVEFEQGKENWAYSCNPETGEVVPGVINWAGVTRKNTEVIKITLDNGETLTCTPDHKIPVFGKGFVEAKDLTDKDSLISFNRRNKSISTDETTNYQQVWDHSEKNWRWTHDIVGKFFKKQNKHQEFTFLTEHKGLEKTTINHKDFNRFNNDPRNLQYMNIDDFTLYHSSINGNFWNNVSQLQRDVISKKILDTTKQDWKELNFNEKKRRLSKLKDSQIKIKTQQSSITFEVLQKIADYVKQGYTNKNQVVEMVKNSNSTQFDYKNAQCNKDFNKFGHSKLNFTLKSFGYKNWKSFVNEIDNFNHRVVKIEKVSNRDTGTITIDGTEKWHNYHTFAIDSGIFVKNSINEDYFFPQTSEGRGSKVETLPGGTNLGEIDDLKYFTNKLVRGLRIPSSYLPTGAEDASSQYNDGRVGTAYIQELRFNTYCERLQSLLINKFDKEFKKYLLEHGVNIDVSMFDLKFQPPKNFAAYRQSEIDNARIPTFTQMAALPYISNRYALKRFLGLTADEIAENERLWREENEENLTGLDADSSSEMRDLGINSTSIGVDMGGIESELPMDEMPVEGGEMPAEGGEMPPAAGAQPPVA